MERIPTRGHVQRAVFRNPHCIGALAACIDEVYKGCMRWLALFVVLSLAACAGPRGPVQPPHVSLVDLRVIDVKLFEQRYGLQLRVQNPNNVSLPIVGMDYVVRLNGTEFGKGVSRESVSVPAYGESIIEVPVVSNVWSLWQRLQDLQQKELAQGVKVEIAGGVNLAHQADKLPFMFQGEFGGRPARPAKQY